MRSWRKAARFFQTTTDAEMIAYTIARQRLNTGTIEQAVELAMDKLEGAYSLIIMTPGKLVGARDPQGFRPLALGKVRQQLYAGLGKLRL